MLSTRLRLPMQIERLDPLLHGFAQIGFQHNRLSGVLFIVAIALSSPLMLLAALGAMATAFLTARRLGAREDDLQAGLYGYNPALMAIALVIWLPHSWSLALMVLAGGAMTALIMFALRRHSRVPPYSVPFILTAWLMLLISLGSGIGLNTPALIDGAAPAVEVFLSGIGQVGFQQEPLSGALILLAVAVSSLSAAAWTALAALTSLVLAQLISADPALTASGLFGFNAILATLVLSQYAGLSGWHKPLVILLATSLTVVLTAAFISIGMIAFTTPFVTTLYLIGFVDWQRKQRLG